MCGRCCAAKRERSQSSDQDTYVEARSLASTHALIPSTRLGPIHVETIGEHLKGLRCKLQLSLAFFRRARLVERVLFLPFGHESHARAIPGENLEQTPPVVGTERR